LQAQAYLMFFQLTMIRCEEISFDTSLSEIHVERAGRIFRSRSEGRRRNPKWSSPTLNESDGSGPRFPIAVVQAIFNVFAFHFLKNRAPGLRGCLKERPSQRFTKDHRPAIVGISDSRLRRRFCARFASFHLLTFRDRGWRISDVRKAAQQGKQSHLRQNIGESIHLKPDCCIFFACGCAEPVRPRHSCNRVNPLWSRALKSDSDQRMIDSAAPGL
jgi:hypothetical protein